MATFGVSFVPGQNGDNGEAANGSGRSDRFQEAVRILSLRLPRVLGGSAIAPAPLLQGPGNRGTPFGAVQQTQVAAGAPPPQVQALMRMAGLGGSPQALAPQGAPVRRASQPQARPSAVLPPNIQFGQIPGWTPPPNFNPDTTGWWKAGATPPPPAPPRNQAYTHEVQTQANRPGYWDAGGGFEQGYTEDYWASMA